MTSVARSRFALAVLFAVLASPLATGEEPPPTQGKVEVPLTLYQELVERARETEPERPAPARFALGEARIGVTVSEGDGTALADVMVELPVRILVDEWTSVVVLPAGTAVGRAEVDGDEAPLIATADGLVWATDSSGSYTVRLTYQVSAQKQARGWVLGLPVPPGAAARLTAAVPGADAAVTVVPSVGVRTRSVAGKGTAEQNTVVEATIPATSAVQIVWHAPERKGHVLSRATYHGELERDAVTWQAEFEVELFGPDEVQLQLMPRAVTLRQVEVDGEPKPVAVAGGRFAVTVAGRGAHTVTMGFEVPVTRGSGPPHVSLHIPEVPVSRFELRLPDQKELKVQPVTNVETREDGGATIASAYVPMTGQVTFTWTEAVPEELAEEVRANASIYHAAHAEEGVLHVRALIDWEVTRGETNLAELKVPDNIQLTRIVGRNSPVADWRVTPGEAGQPSRVSVFFDRKVKGKQGFDVEYERLLGAEMQAAELPLVRAASVHRQRGMVALLSSSELALNPERAERVSKVGENQLPPFVRDTVKMTIAHTYKYITEDPMLVVRGVAPERKQGKFDAQVDTLISIGEVTMKGSATIEVNVKSGALMELELQLPGDVNVLGLTGPSLRTHRVETGADGEHTIEVPFTQDMEGQFRLEVSYERILSDKEEDVPVPTVSVVGAEVEHGRIAVEALTAVEVGESGAEQLSPVDVNELPQQLVLKTTNPILLAYKYVLSEAPFELVLKITRHEELSVQAAAIDEAEYATLFTRDGLAVTRARFEVRNSREQFLKVELPPASEVWSVFVDDKAEKPARPSDGDGDDGAAGNSVLIKMINSTSGFRVELFYATQLPKIGTIGTLQAQLPRPHDMVVTQTRWDVYLPAPDDVVWNLEPDSNLELVQAGVPTAAAAVEETMSRTTDGQAVQPLRHYMPTEGLKFSFAKLYANQSDEHAAISIDYTSSTGRRWATGLSVAGALGLWLGLLGLLPPRRLSGTVALVLAAIGFALVLVGIEWLGASWLPAVIASALVLALAVVSHVRRSRADAATAAGVGPAPPPETDA